MGQRESQVQDDTRSDGGSSGNLEEAPDPGCATCMLSYTLLSLERGNSASPRKRGGQFAREISRPSKIWRLRPNSASLAESPSTPRDSLPHTIMAAEGRWERFPDWIIRRPAF